jgi:hypothetical protein
MQKWLLLLTFLKYDKQKAILVLKVDLWRQKEMNHVVPIDKVGLAFFYLFLFCEFQKLLAFTKASEYT